MALNIQFIDANINNYQDIPASLYPVLSGVSLSNVSVNHQASPVFNGILPNSTGVFIKWSYPVTDNLYLRVAVGYQLQVIEGTFAEAQAQSIIPPGTVVFEEISNLKDMPDPIDRYINLQAGGTSRVDIPSAALTGGTKYTVRVRALVFSELGAGAINDQYFKYTEWSIANFRVNNIPRVIGLKTNGEINPTGIPKSNNILFSFTLSDTDGPAYLYRIQVGTTPGVGFSANIWDSGLIAAGLGFGPKDFTVPYTGAALSSGVTYAWRVQVQDGLVDGGWSDAADTFKINTLPTITSLKIDTSEILFGLKPTVADSGMAVTWLFNDADGDTQRAYNLTVSQIVIAISDDFNAGTSEELPQKFEILSTGNVFSTTATVSLPDLPEGGEFEVKIRVRDSIEFGNEFTGRFFSNARPKVLNPRVDGKITPGDIATATPAFSWTFFDSTAGDTQQAFRVQVATNDTFATLLWDSGPVTSALNSVVYGSTPLPVVAPTALTHGSYYYARIAVSDGVSFSEYEPTFFAINTKPNSPTIVSPTASSYSGNITVSWLSASPLDDDGDTVTYSLEITSRRSSNQGWEFLAGPFPSSTTAFVLDTSRLKAGNDYGVRVIANDSYADSDVALGTSAINASGLGFTILNHVPFTPIFLSPSLGDVVTTALKAEWLESNPVDVDGDDVFYILEMTRNSAAASPVYEKVGVFIEGNTKTFIDVSNLPDGAAYRLKITAQDDKGGIGTTNFSPVFSIINTPAITDFEQVGSTTYVSTSDGRVFKATESIWQVEENFVSEDQRVAFEEFVRGDVVATIADGNLKIESPSGATYMLRIGPKPNK